MDNTTYLRGLVNRKSTEPQSLRGGDRFSPDSVQSLECSERLSYEDFSTVKSNTEDLCHITLSRSSGLLPYGFLINSCVLRGS